MEAARLLAGSSASSSASGRPRQAMLRRAVSTAYYAMFHALCQSNADTLEHELERLHLLSDVPAKTHSVLGMGQF